MATTPLSARLRELRRSRWPGHLVNQARVAEALGVTSPSISAYENGTAPPPERLHDYALFFASRRWLGPDAPRRVEDDFLDPAERKTFDELKTELTDLQGASGETAATPDTSGRTGPFWEFPDGAPIRIFCGELDEKDAGRFGSTDDHNYMRLRTVADIDSLFELWGHIRRCNPDSDVRFVVGRHFTSDDLESHVVVLGNIAQTQVRGRLLPEGTLPVRQIDREGLDGEVFEVTDADGRARLVEPVVEDGRVMQDVGLLARTPNPHHHARTLTICSGVFTRGVYGAVRSLTANTMRDGNADYLRQRFENSSAYGVLVRVRVIGDSVATPDLSDGSSRLFEFSVSAS